MGIAHVSLWLGHADVRVTQQRYAFLTIDDLHRALQASPRRGLTVTGTK